MMAQHPPPAPAPVPGEATEQAQSLHCRSCGPSRTLAIISPGRLWWRVRGQTILVTGGRVTLWCPACQAQHDVDLALSA
jgi:hypothetical protein